MEIICPIIFYIWVIIFIAGGLTMKSEYDSLKDLLEPIRTEFNKKNLFGKIQIMFLCIAVMWPMYLGYIIFSILHNMLNYIIRLGNRN